MLANPKLWVYLFPVLLVVLQSRLSWILDFGNDASTVAAVPVIQTEGSANLIGCRESHVASSFKIEAHCKK